jgi:GntR family transcriptional repressor for pyruvate dehydrogenase complex
MDIAVNADFFAGAPYRRDRTGAADQVLHDLRTRILSGALPRGTRLPSEKELAAYYQVSSPTVREATRALSAMSLVDVRHGAGTFVTADSSTLMAAAMTAVVELESIDLHSILELSETLYQQAVALAIDVADDEEIQALREAAERFYSVNDDEFARALEAFLKALVATSHNRLLVAVSTYLIETQISLARDVARASPSVWERIAGQLIEERLAIVRALEARDRAAASQAITVYLGRGRELVRENVTTKVTKRP